MSARTVLLYGQSLLLSGVAAGLAEVPGLQVEKSRTWAEAGQRLLEHMPDVLIFDLTETCECHILPLLLKDPHPVLVGLDTEHNQAVLISGRAAQSLTLGQIRQIAAGERRGQGEEDAGSEPLEVEG
jgi:hypothetical protein